MASRVGRGAVGLVRLLSILELRRSPIGPRTILGFIGISSMIKQVLFIH